MAKRAVLLDRDNVIVAHLEFREMDEYIRRGEVERLTSLKAKTHVFRLLTQQEKGDTKVLGQMESMQAVLPACVMRANAGVANSSLTVLWARRLVRVWPTVGDTRAVRVGCNVVKRSRPSQRRELKEMASS